jgi:ribosome biogenesis GTPase
MSRWDEEAQYDRPRRRTRPRTKDRPAHEDAVPAMVTTRDRGRYTLLVGDGPPGEGGEGGEARVVTAMKSRPLGRKGVVVGDRVRVVGANADQLVVVTALADPPPRLGLIDRCLVAAFAEGMDALLCLTKADLASPDELLAAYRPLGVQAVATQRGGDLSALSERLDGRISVMVGHSGVGKSTLVNALVPGARRDTGGVNVVTGRGRHTSTSAIALALPAGGWIVDTPGIRSFGLAHVDPDGLLQAFPDLAEAATECSRGCTHGAEAPECGLDLAVTEGRADAVRVASFRRLLESRESDRD